MKTKLLFTFVFLTLLVDKSSSQNYIPLLNNSSWNIIIAGQLGGQNYVINPIANIVIGSNNYQQYLDPYTNTDVFLREDVAAKKIYRNIGGSDQLLYDFSLQVSNTIILPDGKLYTVQSISDINVNGGTRRRFNLLHFIGTFVARSETWIEGVGSPNHPLKPQYELPADPYIYLTCSAQTGINIYNNGIANGQQNPTDCSMLLSVNDINHLKQKINLSPNPFKNELLITRKLYFENSTFKIYNSIGQLIKQIGNLSGQNIIIKRDNLNSGIYFTQLIENGQIISTDKIIISD